MSSIKQQSVAKGMRWAARIIGLLVTLGALFYLVIGGGEAVNAFQKEGFGSQDFLELSIVGLFMVVAAAGGIISWWRVRLGGALLVSTYFMIVAFGIWMRDYLYASLMGLPFLVAGILFLIAWWLSRKASSSALSSSTLSSNTPPSQR